MSRGPITVLLADDHPMFREGLRFTLSRAEDVDVVGEAADGLEALALLEQTEPEVVLMDINMPGADGLTVTRRLVERGSRSKVLVLTMYDDDANILAAMRSGAHGYLLKGAGPEQILSAVRAVADGHAVFGASLAGQLLSVFGDGREPAVEAAGPAVGLPALSVRENEVLTHLAEGLSNQEIAAALFISPITVRNHVSSILTKLQVPNRRQAMLRAREPRV